MIRKLLTVLLISLAVLSGCKEKKEIRSVTGSFSTPYFHSSTLGHLQDGLNIHFSGSAARVDLINKDVSSFVKLTPAVKGTWKFTSDTALTFTPAEDYRQDTAYTFVLDEKVFTDTVKVQDLKFTFATPSFTAAIDEVTLYTDPVQPSIKKMTATLAFTYPPETASVRDALSLVVGTRKIPFELTQDKDSPSIFYIVSEPLQIQTKEYYVNLNLKTALSAKDKARLSESVSDSLRVPASDEFFKVSSVSTAIIRNEQDQNKPEQILFVSFSSPVRLADLEKYIDVRILTRPSSTTKTTEELFAESPKVKLTALPIEKEFSDVFTFKYDYVSKNSSERLYVRLKEGLPSVDNFVFSKPVDQQLYIPAYPKELTIGFDGSVLSSRAAAKLPVLTRGLPGIKVRLARIPVSQLNHLVSQTYGDLRRMDFANYRFDETNIADTFDVKLPLVERHPSEANYASVDLSQYLSKGQGFFYVSVNGYDPKNDNTLAGYDRRFIIVTDLGMLVKDNADGSKEVYVSSFKEGLPIEDATVTVLAKNGRTLLTATTDSKGRASFPSFKNFVREKEPVAYVVSYAGDYAFMPVSKSDRQLNFSKFDTGGQYDSPAPETLMAFMFNDRGLYRPGEDVSFGIALKAKDFRQLSDLPLELRVLDPRGTTVFTQKVKLPKSGFFDITYPTQPHYQTGEYTARLYLLRDKQSDQFLGSSLFTLREFEPDKLKIRLATDPLPPAGWLSDKTFKVKVDLQNLFGFPATDRRVTGRYTLTPVSFNLDDYGSYVFTDPLRSNSLLRTESMILPEARTDDKGQAEFTVDLTRYAGGTYLMDFYAEGFDVAGGRGVAGKTKLLLSPLDMIIGHKADGSLYGLKQKAARKVDFIAVTPEGKKAAAAGLTLKIIQQQYVSTLVRQPNSTYKYQSILKESEVVNAPFTLPAAGASYTLPTDKPGDFLLHLTDKKGTLVSSLSFSVLGQSNEKLALDKNAELALKLDRSEYRSGDPITLSITAPYTGYGLITIERDKVYASKWFKTTTTSSVQTITLPSSVEGNAYVNVAFMRDFGSKEIFTSPLSYAVKPFNVNLADRTVKIDLSVPTLVKSGEKLDVKYKTDTSSRIVIFGVDEGILQLANYATPDPLNFFFKKQALLVNTFQTVDLILPDFSLVKMLSGIGGDSEEMADMASSKEIAAPRQLNPFARKTVKAVAFWSGVMDAGTEEKTYSTVMPDTFNGTMRVMAVAVSPSAIGSSSKKLNVRAPIVLSPSAPVFSAPSDTFTTTIGVFNAVKGSKSQEVVVTVEGTEHFEITGDAKPLTLSEGQEKSQSFTVKVKDKLGQGFLTYTAEVKGQPETRSKQRFEISVRPAVALTTKLHYGMLKSSYTTPELTPFYAEKRISEIHASRSPMVLAKGMLRYLDSYPHVCTEQLISRIYPKFSLVPYKLVDTKKTYDEVVSVFDNLRQRQTYAGGFTLWPNGRSVHAEATVYAVSFLTDASKDGYPVPRDLLGNAITWLRSYVGEKPTGTYDLRVRAQGVYLLAQNGIAVSPTLLKLEEYGKANVKNFHQDISSLYLGAAASLLKDATRAQQLSAGYKISKENDFSDDLAAVVLLARHFPDRLSGLKQDFFKRSFEYIANTPVGTGMSAAILRAFAAYADAGFDQQMDLTLTADIGKEKKELATDTDNSFRHAALSADITRVKLSSDDPFFYVLTQEGFVKDLPTKQIFNGFEVHRVFVNADGKEVSSFKVGDEITVNLTIRSSKESVSDVVLVDLLPTGFELTSKTPTISSGYFDYYDLREDRHLFYLPVSTSVTTVSYQMKPVVSGTFVVPPLYAEGISRLDLTGLSKAEKITVSGM